MNFFGKVAFAGVMLAASSSFAFAASIVANIGAGGAANFTTAGGMVTSFVIPTTTTDSTGTVHNGTITRVTNMGAGDTVSPYFTVGNDVTFSSSAVNVGPMGTTYTITTNATSNGLLFAGTTEAGKILNFYVTSYTVMANSATTGFAGILLTGTGYFTETGFSTTAATFSLNASQTGGTTFSTNGLSTIGATPEPSSLILLGTGLLSAAGVTLRKRSLL